jgi:hypothetical protein
MIACFSWQLSFGRRTGLMRGWVLRHDTLLGQKVWQRQDRKSAAEMEMYNDFDE